MSRIDRRSLLLGAAAALAAPALPRRTWAAASAASIASILDASGLGAVSGFAVADLDAGELIEGHDADVGRPPASVAKVVTTLYALDALGPGYRFRTRLLAAGPIEGGTLRGDLVLEGGGDPVLDTDRLGRLVAALKDARHRARRGPAPRRRRRPALRARRGARPAGGRRLQPDALGDEPQLQPRADELGAGAGSGVRRPGREARGAGRRHRRRGRQGADPSPLRGRARGLVAAGRPGRTGAAATGCRCGRRPPTPARSSSGSRRRPG